MTLLRVVAVAIAIAGLVDPVFTGTHPARQPLTITILSTPSLALPAGELTRRDRSYRAGQALATSLADEFATTLREQSVDALADACPIDGACVVISDGPRPHTLRPREGYLGAVHVGDALVPNVAVTGVAAPRDTSPDAMATLVVDLEARGFAGRVTNVKVLDAGVSVGETTHTWPAAAADLVQNARVVVEWAPLASGSRDLRVVASGDGPEATTIDNEAPAAAAVIERTFNVLVYEPQPSWAGTFVRRALEGDNRFDITRRTRLGPAQAVASTAVPLTAEALERDDIAVVIVASPRLLARDEIETLERVTRLRGTSLVFLLDTPPTGAIERLVGASGVEHREPSPVAAGPIKVSEMIVLRARQPVVPILAAPNTPERPTTTVSNVDTSAPPRADAVIVSRPLGQGHVIASGAVDAWRFRDSGSFDRFWAALAADAAQAAGDQLLLTLSQSVATVGEQVHLDVEWRSVREVREPLEATAMLRCEGHQQPIRLWPAGRRGRFRGTFAAPVPSLCAAEVDVAPLGAAAVPLRIVDLPRGPLASRDELAAAIRAHGGTFVNAGDEAVLVTELRALASPQRQPTLMYPMRSTWWILPFAACLGGEWWVRRRKGQL